MFRMNQETLKLIAERLRNTVEREFGEKKKRFDKQMETYVGSPGCYYPEGRLGVEFNNRDGSIVVYVATSYLIRHQAKDGEIKSFGEIPFMRSLFSECLQDTGLTINDLYIRDDFKPFGSYSGVITIRKTFGFKNGDLVQVTLSDSSYKQFLLRGVIVSISEYNLNLRVLSSEANEKKLHITDKNVYDAHVSYIKKIDLIEPTEELKPLLKLNDLFKQQQKVNKEITDILGK
jgi:hypothetical protein